MIAAPKIMAQGGQSRSQTGASDVDFAHVRVILLNDYIDRIFCSRTFPVNEALLSSSLPLPTSSLPSPTPSSLLSLNIIIDILLSCKRAIKG